jgi:hypothetical protein
LHHNIDSQILWMLRLQVRRNDPDLALELLKRDTGYDAGTLDAAAGSDAMIAIESSQ